MAMTYGFSLVVRGNDATPENFAQIIFGILRDALPAAMLDRIRLYQDSDLFVDVTEPES